MKDHVLVEYSFLFNPQEVWGHVNELEKEIAIFFESKGLEAVGIPLLNQGGKRMILIKTKPPEVVAEPVKIKGVTNG